MGAGKAESPGIVVATGIPVFSARVISSAEASLITTPPPTSRTGRRALWIAAATSLIACADGLGDLPL